MTANNLFVFWNEETVGHLSYGKTSNSISFRYSDEWLKKKGPAISLSMPLQSAAYDQVAHYFFANLLPEGDYRRTIERVLKISKDNDYSLLKTIGGDCAGALTIAAVPPNPELAYYEKFSKSKLIEFIKSNGATALTSNRLSLAGAQGKLPVRLHNTEFELPGDAAPSTHIIKFNSNPTAYPCLVENEYILTQMANQLGLKTIDCDIQQINDEVVLISKRYDRIHLNDWPTKLHQEDLCQALGFSHTQKYQKDGGPSLKQCVAVLRSHLGLYDIQQIVDWYLFNFIAGNCDAHAKNLSLLYQEDFKISLAPFYDLVATMTYPNLDRNLAMEFGGESGIDNVRPHHLKQMAQEIQITQAFLKKRYRRLLARFPDALIQAHAMVAVKLDHRKWEFIVKAIEERIRFLLKQSLV